MSSQTGDQRSGGLGTALKGLWKRSPMSQSGASQEGRSTSAETNGDHSSPKKGKRRQQIYNAQKRHRDRKSQYVRNLEAEIEKLRSLDAAVNTQRLELAKQNSEMRELLARTQQTAEPQVQHVQGTERTGTANVWVERDNIMQHDRLYISPDTGMFGAQLNQMAMSTSDLIVQNEEEDSWLALDFILALEWPCKDHVRHPLTTGAASEPFMLEGEFNGHAMTTTAALLATSCQHPTTAGIRPDILRKWQIPHAEIEKLVNLSCQLDIDDSLITPAQAYSAIRGRVVDKRLLKPILDHMKSLLASVSHCEGLGAVMATDKFEQHLEDSLKSAGIS